MDWKGGKKRHLINILVNCPNIIISKKIGAKNSNPVLIMTIYSSSLGPTSKLRYLTKLKNLDNDAMISTLNLPFASSNRCNPLVSKLVVLKF